MVPESSTIIRPNLTNFKISLTDTFKHALILSLYLEVLLQVAILFCPTFASRDQPRKKGREGRSCHMLENH